MNRAIDKLPQILVLSALVHLAGCNGGQNTSSAGATSTGTRPVSTPAPKAVADPKMPKADYSATVNASTEFDQRFKLGLMSFELTGKVITFTAQVECLADCDQKYVVNTNFVKDLTNVSGFQDIYLVNEAGKPCKKGETVKIKRVVQLAQPFSLAQHPAMGFTVINMETKCPLAVTSSDLMLAPSYTSVVWEFPEQSNRQ